MCVSLPFGGDCDDHVGAARGGHVLEGMPEVREERLVPRRLGVLEGGQVGRVDHGKHEQHRVHYHQAHQLRERTFLVYFR